MQKHKPVLLDQVIKLLSPKPGEKFIDMTAGLGGHSKKLLEKVGKSGHGYLIDRDSSSIQQLKKTFASKNNVEIFHKNFSQIKSLGLPKCEMILMDLGVSSPQIDNINRGFSFKKDSRLDMRMDTSQELSAHDVINKYSEKHLSDLIFLYGEERKARRIAKAIADTRKVRAIDTTVQLAKIVESIVRKTGKIHPATRTFQAIRIEINDELNELKKGLENSLSLLKRNGRLAIISFHSLEDRIVKTFINDNSKDLTDITGKIIKEAYLKKVTKKPILGKAENDNNPRARSAKLRAAMKIK